MSEDRGPRPYQASWWVLGAIRAYQKGLSPLLGRNCRYHPTCSQYAAEAISTHGLPRGGWLAVKRLGRCHPWREGGVDPVPPRATRGVDRVPPRATGGTA